MVPSGWNGVMLQYPRKDNYENYQRNGGKSALVINEGAAVNISASFTIFIKGTYLFNPIFLEKYDKMKKL